MAGLNEVYELRVISSYGTQKLINVLHYIVTVAGAGTSEDMNDEFSGVVVPLWLEVITDTTEILGVETINVDDLGDFNEQAFIGAIGTNTGEGMPVFNALGFKKNRTTRETRPGAVRIGAYTESYNIEGELNPVAIPDVSTLANALGQDLTRAGVTWAPIIFRQEDDEADPPITRVTNLVASVSFERLTTQNSRKR